MITPEQRRVLLKADRSRDVQLIRDTITAVMALNQSATLLDCEMCFRDAAAQTYLVVDKDGGLHIVFGIQARLAKLLEVSAGNATHIPGLKQCR
jgi:hypothetical protein